MNAPISRVPKQLDASAKTCVIYAEPAGATQYGWGWRSASKRSKGVFRYFYECVQDARKHGYTVDFAEVAQSMRSPRSPDS